MQETHPGVPEETEFGMQSEFCDCSENEDLVMDKLASVSYIAMLSVVAYGLLAISIFTIA